MKSILALLVIVSVAYAGVLSNKEGALKGSWDLEVGVDSATADVTAPTFAYYSSTSYDLIEINVGDFEDTGIYNASDYYYSSVTGYVYFAIGGEATYDDSTYHRFAYDGTVVATLWTGEGDAMRTFPLACSIDSDNDVSCSFTIMEHGYPGVYTLSITAMDGFGNWATFGATDFTDDTRGTGVFTLQVEHPDTMNPTVTTAVVSKDTVEVGAEADLDDDSQFTEISATVGDGYWYDTDMDAAAYDWKSSDIRGVYVSLGMEDGTVEDWPLWKGVEVGDDVGTFKYGIRITFFPVFNAGEWDIVSIWAEDNAGNKGVALIGTTFTVTQNTDAVEADNGVLSCQTLEFTDADVTDPTVNYELDSADETNVYFTATCIEKSETNDNYFSVALQTPSYMPDGWTVETTQQYWNYGSGNSVYGWTQTMNFNNGVSYEVGAVGVLAGYASAPGITISSGTDFGTATGYIALPPNGQEGDYELSEVYAITSFGAMQRYSLEFGSASAAVPSVFAVAVAAAVALLL